MYCDNWDDCKAFSMDKVCCPLHAGKGYFIVVAISTISEQFFSLMWIFYCNLIILLSHVKMEVCKIWKKLHHSIIITAILSNPKATPKWKIHILGGQCKWKIYTSIKTLSFPKWVSFLPTVWTSGGDYQFIIANEIWRIGDQLLSGDFNNTTLKAKLFD